MSHSPGLGSRQSLVSAKLGCSRSLPTSWTDVGAVDPCVALAAERSLFQVADLLDWLGRSADGSRRESREL